MMDYFKQLMDGILERSVREISAIPTENLTPTIKAEILGIVEGCIHDSFNQIIYSNLGPMSEEDSIVEYFNPDTEIDIC